MKVEHITALTGHTAVRDTDGISKEVVEHFKFCQIADRKIQDVKIPQTELSISITAAMGLALFDLKHDKDILFTNVCCFKDSDKEAALLYVKQYGDMLNYRQILRQPDTGKFLYTFMVNITFRIDLVQLCGEIEFYIWDALRRANT